jgi:hypothetical protein
LPRTRTPGDRARVVYYRDITPQEKFFPKTQVLQRSDLQYAMLSLPSSGAPYAAQKRQVMGPSEPRMLLP